MYASRILKLVVDRFHDHSVREVRFVSGMNPAYVDSQGSHFLELAFLSNERVCEIHQLCRLVADDPVAEESQAATTYTFVLRDFGRVVCTFKRQGSASSLTVARDLDAVEAIDAIRPRRLPSLRAEAQPESEETENHGNS